MIVSLFIGLRYSGGIFLDIQKCRTSLLPQTLPHLRIMNELGLDNYIHRTFMFKKIPVVPGLIGLHSLMSTMK